MAYGTTQFTNRWRRCSRCGRISEHVDMVHDSALNVCWPCWSLVCAERGWTAWGPMPDGWWQSCDRCSVRTWVQTDRPLCPICVRVPDRWREILVICRSCGQLYGRTGQAKCCDDCRGPRWKRLMAARQIGKHSAAEWRARCLQLGYGCIYCGAVGVLITKDHVQPVARGGSDAVENLVPACQFCNSSKNDRTVEEWKGREFAREFARVLRRAA